MKFERLKLYKPYVVMLCVYFLFIVMAFVNDSPFEIIDGLQKIATSRSVLLTDYVYVGGIGAALVNSALVGIFGIIILVKNGVKPNGSIIMAMWLTAGFALFGKNLVNMIPITFGVYLYSRFQKEKFINFTLIALLSATMSPVVSGIWFSDIARPVINAYIGISLGIGVGFIFPAVSSYTTRVHSGYNLYNMGFAGGLISTFLVSALSSVGINMETNLTWSTGNNLTFAILLYIIFAGLIVCGIVWGGGLKVLKEYPGYFKHTGRLVTDFFALFGERTYFNMGLTGLISTTLMLLLGCDLNGPTLGGIFTIVGFSAFGKHIMNIWPLLAGAILSARANMWDPTMPSNTLAILFSTGLAPIAGQFGWIWGIIAGFLHVNMIHHIGFLNSGLNLYNNGFAAGFVAIIILPIATALSKESSADN